MRGRAGRQAGSQSLSSLQSSSPLIKAGCTVLAASGETQVPFALKPCKSRLYWQKGFPEHGGPGDGKRAAGVGSGSMWGSGFLYPGQPAQDRGREGLHSTNTASCQGQGDAKLIYGIKIQR